MSSYSEPVKLIPSYFSSIWGGTLLRDYLGKDIPSGDIGESWEVLGVSAWAIHSRKRAG